MIETFFWVYGGGMIGGFIVALIGVFAEGRWKVIGWVLIGLGCLSGLLATVYFICGLSSI